MMTMDFYDTMDAMNDFGPRRMIYGLMYAKAGLFTFLDSISMPTIVAMLYSSAVTTKHVQQNLLRYLFSSVEL